MAKSQSSIKSTEPQTMEELLAMEGVELRGLKRGDVVEGVVSQIQGRTVSLDIGAKTDGWITDKEFAAAREYIKTLNVGDTIEAMVIVPENDAGQILLSLRSAAEEFNWAKIKEWKDADEIIKVHVSEVNRGGAIVTVIDEINGFIPGSQFSQAVQERLEEFAGKDIEVKIMDFDRVEGKLILSEKAVSEAEDLDRRRNLIALLTEGQSYDGVVTRVVPFGLFVKIMVEEEKLREMNMEGVDLEGLVHISELSWEKIVDPATVATVGSRVTFKVIKADPQIGKMSLSIKQLTQDPWLGIAEKYPVDKQVQAVVARIAPFGVFIELEKGVEGLIHVSKLSTDQDFVPGKSIDVYIESIDVPGRRISLGMVLKSIPVGYK